MNKRARADAVSGAWTTASTESAQSYERRLQFGKQLREHLLQKHMTSTDMPAVDVCTIAYFATMSGTIGVEDISLDPNSSDLDRHASDHIRLILARDNHDPKLYYVSCPIYNKTAQRRDSMSLPIRLPTEILADDYAESDRNIDESVCDRDWHPAFAQHPVVTRSLSNGVPWQIILPLALYWDGICYTTRENVLVFTIQDLRTLRRHIVFIIRTGPSL